MPCRSQRSPSAKLLLTDKLIKATAPLSTEGADTHQDGRLEHHGHRRPRSRRIRRQQGRAARDRRRRRARETDRHAASSSRRWRTRSSAPPAPATAPRTTSAPSSTPRPATCACGASLEVVEEPEDHFKQVDLKGAQKLQEGRRDRRLHRRPAAADRVRPDRRPGRQAGHLPEGPRCRARAPV